MEPKTSKRIVSKGDYARGVANVTRMRLEVVGASCMGYFLGVFAIGALCGSLISLCRANLKESGITLGISALLAVISYGLIKGTVSISKQIQSAAPGIPLTRANTTDLPAPDTLVRASSEPVQQQQAVLLRAATQGSERHAEELLRPVSGQE